MNASKTHQVIFMIPGLHTGTDSQSPLAQAHLPVCNQMAKYGHCGRINYPESIRPGAGFALLSLLTPETIITHPCESALAALGSGAEVNYADWITRVSPEPTQALHDYTSNEIQRLCEDLKPSCGTLSTLKMFAKTWPGFLIDSTTNVSAHPWQDLKLSHPKTFDFKQLHKKLPQGSPLARALSTWIQETIEALKTHDIQLTRQEAQRGIIEYLWPWDIGTLPHTNPCADAWRDTIILGNNPIGTGVAQLLNLPHKELSGNALTQDIIGQLNDRSTQIICLLDNSLLDSGHANDTQASIDLLEYMHHQYFAPVYHHLHQHSPHPWHMTLCGTHYWEQKNKRFCNQNQPLLTCHGPHQSEGRDSVFNEVSIANSALHFDSPSVLSNFLMRQTP